MLERNEVRKLLKKRGWSYRRAGAYLGISYPHICLVLQGKRDGNAAWTTAQVRNDANGLSKFGFHA